MVIKSWSEIVPCSRRETKQVWFRPYKYNDSTHFALFHCIGLCGLHNPIWTWTQLRQLSNDSVGCHVNGYSKWPVLYTLLMYKTVSLIATVHRQRWLKWSITENVRFIYPANMAPKLDINHSGELKPRIPTADSGSRPSWKKITLHSQMAAQLTFRTKQQWARCSAFHRQYTQ
jgi:hypothetical protein